MIMKINPVYCPCGCKKVMLPPLVGCQCGTVSEEDAQIAVKAINHYERMENILKQIVGLENLDPFDNKIQIVTTDAKMLLAKLNEPVIIKEYGK